MTDVSYVCDLVQLPASVLSLTGNTPELQLAVTSASGKHAGLARKYNS
jgi:hypothetical protein